MTEPNPQPGDRIVTKDGEFSMHEEGDMCPNCVTPWKCNGPHLPWPSEDEGGNDFYATGPRIKPRWVYAIRDTQGGEE